MAAQRSSSALRSLSKLSQQQRHLHMTGPSTFPSPLLTTAKPSFAKVQSAISDATAASEAESKAPQPTTNRAFNTSRSSKAVNDSSTIDFMYMPDLDPDSDVEPPKLRVPLLPESLYPRSTKTSYTKEESEIVDAEVMRPEIYLASADGTHISAPSAFSDVVDNNSISFEGLKDTLGKTGEVVEQEVGAMKQVWDGLLDDIFGPGDKKK